MILSSLLFSVSYLLSGDNSSLKSGEDTLSPMFFNFSLAKCVHSNLHMWSSATLRFPSGRGVVLQVHA